MQSSEVVCVECKEVFSVSADEQEWLMERGLAMFKRCKSCRLKRRQNKKSQGSNKTKKETNNG